MEAGPAKVYHIQVSGDKQERYDHVLTPAAFSDGVAFDMNARVRRSKGKRGLGQQGAH